MSRKEVNAPGEAMMTREEAIRRWSSPDAPPDSPARAAYEERYRLREEARVGDGDNLAWIEQERDWREMWARVAWAARQAGAWTEAEK